MQIERDRAAFPRRWMKIGAIAGFFVAAASFAACAGPTEETSDGEGGRGASSSSSSSSSASSSGSAGGGGGGSTACEPGATEACYSGPAGTLDVGICKGGTRKCASDGSGFGPCEGEVTPASNETCVTPDDDDCNGLTNDMGVGCICTPAMTEPCYTGAQGTQGVGDCKAGTRTCDDLGSAWSACQGEVVPAIEACGNPTDEDCDGSTCASTLWSIIFGGSASDQVASIAVDSGGNVYVAGVFSGTMTIGVSSINATGGNDAFLAKFDPQGSLLWFQSLGDAADQGATGVAVDAQDNVIVTGYFNGTLVIGANTFIGNGKDGFVAKFGSTGAHLWSKKIGVNGNQAALAVATDKASNVVVAGAFEGQLACAVGCVNSLGLQDIFVYKFSDQGAQLWLKVYADAEDQSPSAVAVDSLDNVIVVGQFKGSAVNFGAGNLLGSAGGYDAFVVKLDPAGATSWVKRFGDPLDQQALAVAVGPMDSIAVAGTFKSTINLGALDLPSSGLTDVFLATFGADGSYQWDHAYGDGAEQTASGVIFDAAGGVYLSGGFQGVVDFGGGALTSLVSYDQFLVYLTDKGVHSWSQRYGDSASQIGKAIARDAATGHIFVSAAASGTTDYGNGPLTSLGGDDITLAKLSP